MLHTSDWHVGRTFHQHATLGALREVFGALVREVREREVDVVLASGDIFDSSTPATDAVELLDDLLLSIHDAGAQVVLTSGNHDSPARLGARAVFAARAGVHVITRADQIGTPVTLTDEHGEVHVYGLPFLEPARLRGVWPDVTPMRSQKDAVGHAMDLVRADAVARGGRTVVMAHTFVQGADGESCESERDIVGGVDKVPVPVFDGVTYAALGHIHGRSTLAPHVRYSGAPLHYSFSEADKPRGGWLVDLDAGGLAAVEWLDLPVPRPLTTLTGALGDLLDDPAHATVEDHWVRAILTDAVQPTDAMRKLQQRFAHCAQVEHRPAGRSDGSGSTYASLVRGRTDLELVDAFLTKVRHGVGATEAELDLVREVVR